MFRVFIVFSIIVCSLFGYMIYEPESLFTNFLTHYWIIYSQNNTPIVGFFTCLGAIFTVCVFYTTYQATKNAEQNLELTRENLRKDDFIKQFSLLLDLHNKSHLTMMENIDKYSEKDNSKIIIGEKHQHNTLINWTLSDVDAAEKLYRKYEFSPYMRTLFRVLKHIDDNFYKDSNKKNNKEQLIKEKKEYSSVVRCMVRNDVLYFVAINALNERSIFHAYKQKLIDFSFFEHINPIEINDKISFNIKQYIKDLNITKFISTIAVQAFNEINNIDLPVKHQVIDETCHFVTPLPFPIIILSTFVEYEFNKLINQITEEIKKSIDEYKIKNTIANYFRTTDSRDNDKLYLYESKSEKDDMKTKTLIEETSIQKEMKIIKKNNECPDKFMKRYNNKSSQNLHISFKKPEDNNIGDCSHITIDHLYYKCTYNIQMSYLESLDKSILLEIITERVEGALNNTDLIKLKNKKIKINSNHKLFQ